jgi:NTP pyrophosphatase (non-canonical NTP hydrolase)
LEDSGGLMNKKLRKIINHYGLNKQLKYFQSEVFELNEAIISERNNGCLENVIDSVFTVLSPLMGTKHVNYKKEHIKEEIADVMVMLKQIQLFYNFSTNEIQDIMKSKIERQIKRIEEGDNGKE